MSWTLHSATHVSYFDFGFFFCFSCIAHHKILLLDGDDNLLKLLSSIFPSSGSTPPHPPRPLPRSRWGARMKMARKGYCSSPESCTAGELEGVDREPKNCDRR